MLNLGASLKSCESAQSRAPDGSLTLTGPTKPSNPVLVKGWSETGTPAAVTGMAWKKHTSIQTFSTDKSSEVKMLSACFISALCSVEKSPDDNCYYQV